MSTPKADARSFARWVALITAVGLIGRVLYVVLVTRHQTVWGDAYFYHESANLIADGKGFIKTGPDLSHDELATARWPLARAPHLLETSLPGVFAVGGVRGGNVKRVASAVGEGSIAVSFVHRVLAGV